jgi:elongation factor G
MASEGIRNLVVVGQGGVGKTSVADALLFAAGATTRVGRVDDGTSVFDTEPEEQRRKSSVSASLHHCTWRRHPITVIDTPGYAAFLHEARNCLPAATGVLFVLGATGGEVKVEAEKLWRWCDERSLPRLGIVTRLDRERASVDLALGDLQGLGAKPAVMQLPIGGEADFGGVVDLLSGRAYVYQGDSGTMREQDPPADLAAAVAAAREQLVEAVAESDDALLEKYLEGNEIGADELRAALEAGTRAGKLLPILCASGTRAIGLHPILDAVVDLLPGPSDLPPWTGTDPATGEDVERPADPQAPFSAFVFKTIVDQHAGKITVVRVVSGRLTNDAANASRDSRERLGNPSRLEGRKQVPAGEVVPGDVVCFTKLKETHTGDTLCDDKQRVVFPALPEAVSAISFALEAKVKADDDKVMQGLHRLMEEDTGLHVHRDEQTNDFVLSGTGQLHVEMAVEQLKRKYGVEVELKAPKVPYKETIRVAAQAQGRHKRQTGGHGQYGDCWLEVSPRPRGAGFEFENGIVGGVIPRGFIPAIEKGVREVLVKGLLAGYPIVDVKVRVYDGSYHDVDSSEMAFKIAAALGFKKAFEQCRPVLLEPIMAMTVTVPDEHLGDIIGDLNSRRGRVLGTEPKGIGNQAVRAHVPMSEVLRYAPDLRSMTSGRGDFELELDHYDEVPAHIGEKIVKESRTARDE